MWNMRSPFGRPAMNRGGHRLHRRSYAPMSDVYGQRENGSLRTRAAASSGVAAKDLNRERTRNPTPAAQMIAKASGPEHHRPQRDPKFKAKAWRRVPGSRTSRSGSKDKRGSFVESTIVFAGYERPLSGDRTRHAGREPSGSGRIGEEGRRTTIQDMLHRWRSNRNSALEIRTRSCEIEIQAEWQRIAERPAFGQPRR
jgi:hypothetical protein